MVTSDKHLLYVKILNIQNQHLKWIQDTGNLVQMVQADLHASRLAGWILCANWKTSMAKCTTERRQPVSGLLKLTQVNRLLAQVCMQLENTLFGLEGFSLPWKILGMQRALKSFASYSSEVELSLELSHFSRSNGWMSVHFELTWVSRRGWGGCSSAASCLSSQQLFPEVYASLMNRNCFLQFLQELSVGRKTMGSQLWIPMSFFVCEQQNQAFLCYFNNALQI